MDAITKLEGARRHLDEAIKLFFEDRDPLVVHTVVAAAQGTLRDIAKATGTAHLSILHDHPNIPAENRTDWINRLNRPRNFFKHADKDHDAILEFDIKDNIDTLLDSVLLYWAVHSEPLSSANVFMGWFTTKHPEMRGSFSENKIGNYCARNGFSPESKRQFRDLIDTRVLLDPAVSRHVPPP
ncbi:MAG: hypothetical protein JSS00_08875 [Proteobacteria bacterium]|nr:hypothetical protein [Pseudomonadota bacterium]